MSTESDDDIDEIIKQASQIVVAMPAKAAGTTMKEFTKACVKKNVPDNFLNDKNKIKKVLSESKSLSMPKIIASHLYKDQPLRTLIQQLPNSSLLIYIHREEKDRVVSAINHVYTYKQIRSKFCDIEYDFKNGTCIVGQKSLIKSIEERTWEIGCG